MPWILSTTFRRRLLTHSSSRSTRPTKRRSVASLPNDISSRRRLLKLPERCHHSVNSTSTRNPAPKSAICTQPFFRFFQIRYAPGTLRSFSGVFTALAVGIVTASAAFVAELLYSNFTRTQALEDERAPKRTRFTIELVWSPEVRRFYYF